MLGETRSAWPRWWAGHEARDLPVMLRQAAAEMERMVRAGADEQTAERLDGLSFSALAVLRLLAEAPRRPMVLAAALQMSEQGMRKILRELQARGLVACAPSWQHDAGLVASLTGSGAVAAATVDEIIDDALTPLADALPPPLLELLVVALRLVNAPDTDRWLAEYHAAQPLLDRLAAGARQGG